jgi:pyruvate formate lyase activating enzyme
MQDVRPTPESTVTKAMEIGEAAGLHYVYAGNSQQNMSTSCHECGHPLVRRAGYVIVRNQVTEAGQCPECGTPVAGIGMQGR